MGRKARFQKAENASESQNEGEHQDPEDITTPFSKSSNDQGEDFEDGSANGEDHGAGFEDRSANGEDHGEGDEPVENASELQDHGEHQVPEDMENSDVEKYFSDDQGEDFGKG